MGLFSVIRLRGMRDFVERVVGRGCSGSAFRLNPSVGKRAPYLAARVSGLTTRLFRCERYNVASAISPGVS